MWPLLCRHKVAAHSTRTSSGSRFICWHYEEPCWCMVCVLATVVDCDAFAQPTVECLSVPPPFIPRCSVWTAALRTGDKEIKTDRVNCLISSYCGVSKGFRRAIKLYLCDWNKFFYLKCLLFLPSRWNPFCGWKAGGVEKCAKANCAEVNCAMKVNENTKVLKGKN